MKTLLLLHALGLVLFTSCCMRTEMPLDPMTMKPSTKCLPENAMHGRVIDSGK